MTYMSGIRAAGLMVVGLGATPVFAQTLTVSAEAEAAIELAEELYPEVFVDGSEFREALGYIYRFYAESGVYVGIKDGEISLMGGPFGSSIVSKGSVTNVLMVLEETKANVEVTPTAAMLELFELAEDFQPSLFSGGSALSTSADGYLYRYYADSGVYAAIRDGQVFLKGGVFGSFYTSRGALNNLIARLDEQVNGNPNPNPNPIPEGDFTLTVTGIVTVLGSSSAVNAVIEDMPAPDASDEQEIREAFEEFVASQPGTEAFVITSLTVSDISSSANRVQFSALVVGSITTQGFSASYTFDLDFDYRK